MKCSRCGGHVSTGWEPSWYSGTISLANSGQLFAYLGGSKGCAEAEHFEWLQRQNKESHPAIKGLSAQKARIKWGPQENYILCWDCHKKFLNLVGEFLGIAKEVEEIKYSLEMEDRVAEKDW